MGVLDMLGGRRGGGVSPVTMALVGVLAYQALKNKGRIADMLGANQPGGGLAGMGGLGALLGGGALTGGLKDLLDRFRQNGHETKAQSWVSTGANEPIAAHELEQALGDERIDWLVGQTGLSRQELLAKLSGELPAAVNELTPNGQLPTEEEVMQRLNLPGK